MATDIKVYGCLNARTSDGKVAKAGQVYDEQREAFQENINTGVLQRITTAETNIANNVIDTVSTMNNSTSATVSVKQHGMVAKSATLPAASTTKAGILKAADYKKFNDTYNDHVSQSELGDEVESYKGRLREIKFYGDTTPDIEHLPYVVRNELWLKPDTNAPDNRGNLYIVSLGEQPVEYDIESDLGDNAQNTLFICPVQSFGLWVHEVGQNIDSSRVRRIGNQTEYTNGQPAIRARKDGLVIWDEYGHEMMHFRGTDDVEDSTPRVSIYGGIVDHDITLTSVDAIMEYTNEDGQAHLKIANGKGDIILDSLQYVDATNEGYTKIKREDNDILIAKPNTTTLQLTAGSVHVKMQSGKTEIKNPTQVDVIAGTKARIVAPTVSIKPNTQSGTSDTMTVSSDAVRVKTDLNVTGAITISDSNGDGVYSLKFNNDFYYPTIRFYGVENKDVSLTPHILKGDAMIYIGEAIEGRMIRETTAALSNLGFSPSEFPNLSGVLLFYDSSDNNQLKMIPDVVITQNGTYVFETLNTDRTLYAAAVDCDYGDIYKMNADLYDSDDWYLEANAYSGAWERLHEDDIMPFYATNKYVDQKTSDVDTRLTSVLNGQTEATILKANTVSVQGKIGFTAPVEGYTPQIIIPSARIGTIAFEQSGYRASRISISMPYYNTPGAITPADWDDVIRIYRNEIEVNANTHIQSLAVSGTMNVTGAATIPNIAPDSVGKNVVRMGVIDESWIDGDTYNSTTGVSAASITQSGNRILIQLIDDLEEHLIAWAENGLILHLPLNIVSSTTNESMRLCVHLNLCGEFISGESYIMSDTKLTFIHQMGDYSITVIAYKKNNNDVWETVTGSDLNDIYNDYFSHIYGTGHST